MCEFLPDNSGTEREYKEIEKTNSMMKKHGAWSPTFEPSFSIMHSGQGSILYMQVFHFHVTFVCRLHLLGRTSKKLEASGKFQVLLLLL
jgi:hypothetical protein